MRRSAIALAAALLAVVATAPAFETEPTFPRAKDAADESWRPNYMTFDVERRTYAIVTDDPESTDEEALKLSFAIDALDPFTHDGAAIDEERERLYTTRHTQVGMSLRPNGSIFYRKTWQHGEHADRKYILHDLDIPAFTNLHRSLNPLMALHPLAQILPEFDEMRMTGYMIENRALEDDGSIVSISPTYFWRLETDPETGRPNRLTQHSVEHGWVLRETEFDDWEPMPSGRTLPRTVTTRTLLYGEVPVVEMRFTNVTELIEPDDYFAVEGAPPTPESTPAPTPVPQRQSAAATQSAPSPQDNTRVAYSPMDLAPPTPHSEATIEPAPGTSRLRQWSLVGVVIMIIAGAIRLTRR